MFSHSIQLQCNPFLLAQRRSVLGAVDTHGEKEVPLIHIC